MGCGPSTPAGIHKDGKVDYRARKAAHARTHKHDGPSGRLPASIDEQNKRKAPRVLRYHSGAVRLHAIPGETSGGFGGKAHDLAHVHERV